MLRPNPDLQPNQADNARRLYELLKAVLPACFSDVQVVDTSIGKRRLVDLYREAYMSVDDDPLQAWARVYDADEPPPVFAGLLEEAMDGALVIIFEASPVLSRFMTRRGIPFVDIRLHPARFLDDIILWFRASPAEMDQRLHRFSIGDDLLVAAVQAARSRYSGTKPILPKNALVFLAQCSRDSSLIQDSRFVSLVDRASDLRSLVGGKPSFVKPHPHDPRSINGIEWTRQFPDAQWLEINLYALLASHDSLECVTISSSAGFEADLFGHRVHTLSSRSVSRHAPIHNLYSPILSAYWSPDFWEWVCGRRRSPPPRDTPPFKSGRLRTAMGFSWSASLP